MATLVRDGYRITGIAVDVGFACCLVRLIAGTESRLTLQTLPVPTAPDEGVQHSDTDRQSGLQRAQ